ncbi:MAG: glycosyltransferase [Alphaproteobacteria bacterium]|nr:MAG: glycosyltransferase [Alphaproteobacteria bacterium]
MGIDNSTAAVIVTYNRAAKLGRTLDSVLGQTVRPDAIYVIDNASTDDTPRVIAERATEGLHHIRLPENIGGAGGFHEGVKRAYADGHAFMWLMDDDSYPEPEALGTLIAAIRGFETRFGHRPSFACSFVKWVDGTLCEMNTPFPVWDWPRFYSAETPWFLVSSCSFVSALVPRWAVTAHGYPIRDYFIWYDDAEFTQRISRSYPGIFVPESVVIHDIPENKGVNYSLVNEANLWKFRYGARNEASFRWREQGLYGVLVFLRGVMRQMKAGGVPWRLRRQVLAALLRGITFRPAIEKP